MSEELMLVIPEDQQGLAKHATDEEFDKLSTSSKYLPRLQLFGSSSNACKEGKIPIGKWGLQFGQRIDNLGDEIRGYVIALRLKAVDLSAEPIISYYDPKSPEFIKLKERSEVENLGPMAGPEFLIYLPNEKKFCTLFMSSKTMKREAPEVKALLRKPATFKIQFIKKGGFAWHGPVVTPCTVPLPKPDEETLAIVLHNFNNPPVSEIEPVDEKAKEATARDR